MKFKISKEMSRCIEDMKGEAIEIFKDIPTGKVLEIKKKPTKNKVFDFQIMNFGKLGIRIYINQRFYKMIYFSNGKWS